MGKKNTSDPILTIQHLKEQLNSFLDHSMLVLRHMPIEEITIQPGTPWNPPTDIVENDSEFKIFMDLPGVTKNDVTISLEGNNIHIQGQRAPLPTGDNIEVVASERTHDVFERTIAITDGIDEEGIATALTCGVLRITLPKRKPKTISIK